jgi:hypothetical protein
MERLVGWMGRIAVKKWSSSQRGLHERNAGWVRKNRPAGMCNRVTTTRTRQEGLTRFLGNPLSAHSVRFLGWHRLKEQRIMWEMSAAPKVPRRVLRELWLWSAAAH